MLLENVPAEVVEEALAATTALDAGAEGAVSHHQQQKYANQANAQYQDQAQAQQMADMQAQQVALAQQQQ